MNTVAEGSGLDVARECVLLSYDEPRVAEHLRLLTAVFPVVRRSHGVRGMARAYRRCAEVAGTAEFFLADADLAIDPAFDPVAASPLDTGVPLRVWGTRNPVNGLVYGYGGLKLCRRTAFAQLDTTATGAGSGVVDVLAALPGRPELTAQVAGETRFDTSARHAWRGGFRECAMLTRGCDYGRIRSAEAEHRLRIWQSVGHGPFGGWAVRGARDGVDFAHQAVNAPSIWASLNDPHWLDGRFAQLGHEAAGA